MKQVRLIFSVLFGLFVIPVLVNGQLSTTAATKMIEIDPTEITNYQCPIGLVNCITGTVPQSYIGNDGCTHWKCIPRTEECPRELVNCAVGTVPQSYTGNDGCTHWKCVPKANECPVELVNCITGTVPQSYIGNDGCTHWKCIPRTEECPRELVNCAVGTVPQSYTGNDGCTHWECVPQTTTVCPAGCVCKDDIITCPITGTRPIEVKISGESGTKTVSIEQVSGGLSLQSEKATAITTEKLVIEENKLSLKTSTGNKEIRILPEEASSKATAVTNINTIELKEESQQVIYSVKGTKQAKLLFVISVSIQIETKVSAESGNVISVKKPWWSFLAR